MLTNPAVWSDDAIRDAMVSGHISELSGLEELERRHGKECSELNCCTDGVCEICTCCDRGYCSHEREPATRPPTPLEVFGR